MPGEQLTAGSPQEQIARLINQVKAKWAQWTKIAGFDQNVLDKVSVSTFKYQLNIKKRINVNISTVMHKCIEMNTFMTVKRGAAFHHKCIGRRNAVQLCEVL